MAFDGRLHRSTAQADYLRGRANERPAVATLARGLLTESYVYAREHARLICARTFRPTFPYIESLSLSQIVFAWARVPAFATALLVEIRHALAAADAHGIHRLQLNGSPNLQSAQVRGEGNTGVGSQYRAATIRFPLVQGDLDASGIGRDGFYLEVQAYGTDAGETTAIGYRPKSVVVSWLSEY